MKRDARSLTRLQGAIAIASFSAGVALAFICIVFLPPIGEISNSAISIVSELLVLTGAILGIKTSFDTRLAKFEGEVERRIEQERRGASDDSVQS